MTRALVLGRIRTGRPIEEIVEDVARMLRREDWRVRTEVVKRKRELRRAARRAVKRGDDIVVVVGGDGAVLQVATRVAGSKVSIGVVPTGTGNLLAGNLDLPHDPRKAVEVIVRGRRRRIDVGRTVVDGRTRCFTVACGIGYDAEVMDETPRKEKTRFGQAAYLAHAWERLSGLRNRPHVITLDRERLETEAAQVFIANQGRVLPAVTTRRPVRPDDGRLDVILVRANGPLPGLLAGFEALTQRSLGDSDGGRAFRARARRVRVETEPPRLVELDGSVVGTTPVEVEVMPKALRIMVPR